MVRDIASVKEQVSAVRADMAALMDEVTDVEASSEASVALLREVLLVKQRMAAVGEMLRSADRVAQLMRSAEAAFGRGDSSTAHPGVIKGLIKESSKGRQGAIKAPSRRHQGVIKVSSRG